MTTQQDGEPAKVTYYGTDNEMFEHETADEAMDSLDDDDLLKVGAEFYSCEFTKIDLAREFLSAGWILETAEERLYDEIEGSAEDAFSVTSEAAAEFNALMGEWCAKHITRTCYRPAAKTTRHTVTAEDLELRNGR